jgi:adenine phosphoribosyltransferase
MNEKILVRESIRTVPDFPVPGIMFRDVTTLMKDKSAFRASINCLVSEAEKFPAFDCVAGIEARGFVFGALLADRMNAGFVPLRKPGKLPSNVFSVEYELEYGKDIMEVHSDAIKKGMKFLLVDDLLATGGTAEAACRLVEKGGGIVIGCLFLIELPDLFGRLKLTQRKVLSVVEFKGK